MSSHACLLPHRPLPLGSEGGEGGGNITTNPFHRPSQSRLVQEPEWNHLFCDGHCLRIGEGRGHQLFPSRCHQSVYLAHNIGQALLIKRRLVAGKKRILSPPTKPLDLSKQGLVGFRFHIEDNGFLSPPSLHEL